ncbi:MAG: metallophosphoesterase family protein [Phycisphaerae bacterium]
MSIPLRFGPRTRTRTRAAAALAACALLSCTPTATATSDGVVEPAAPNLEFDMPGLFAPTLGRPAFVEPGGTLQVVARIPKARGTVEFDLVRDGSPQQRHRLECESDAVERLTAGQPLHLKVPSTVPRQTYDLEIRYNGKRLLGRHCVAVGHVGRVLRLVHLGNMNVGDVGAPHFDQRLIDEINLVAPTLIVATGDFLDATHVDPPVGWRQLVDYLTRFDAPLVMACGDHDDIELYSRHVASSPIGLIDVGPHRGLVLFDQPLAPIHNDAEQLRWAERVLARAGFDGMTIVVTHDDCPNLLRYWREQGTLTRMIRTGRIGLWLAGGHRDWDDRAFSELIGDAGPMVYLRTHQSSAAPREGATGISHYRIVDVADDRVILPGETPASSDTPPSTPVGYLRATFDGPNDGSETGLGFSVVNNLPYRLDGLALRLQLRKLGGQTPWCHGARLEQVIDLGTVWECRVRFDLPDKGGLHAAAGSGPPPVRSAVDVHFDAGSTFRFRRHLTRQGLTYLALKSDSPVVHVQNSGDDVVAISPLVRLDGDPVAYRPLDGDARFATAYRLRLQPGETAGLQLDLSAVRVAPGRRELQVYLQGAAVVVPFCHALDVVIDR